MGDPTSEISSSDVDRTIEDRSGESWASEASEASEAFDDDSEAIDERPAKRRDVDATVLVGGEDHEARNVRSAHRYKLAVFVLLGFAGILTFGAAVRFWLPPWAPLVAFCVLGVAPLFFWAAMGALIFDPTKTKEGFVGKDSPPLALRLRLALLPVAAAAMVGSIIATLWYVAPVRKVVIQISASQRLTETLEGALRDEDEGVRLQACLGLTELKDDSSTQLFVALQDTSDEVVNCALDALPPQELAPTQLSISVMNWQAELNQGTEDRLSGDRACMLSNRIRVAQRKGVNNAPMHLMRCALDAQSGPARECCAQSFRALLGGNDVEPASIMASPSELIHNGFFHSVPTLLKATHSKEPEWERKRLALRLDSPTSRAWAMSVACESLNAGGADRRQPISAAMAKSVSSDTCQIGPAEETTVRLWTAVCSELFSAERVASADGTESDKFCQAINGTLVADANNEARQITQEAYRAARQPGRSKEMMKMLLDYSGRMARATLGNDGTTPDQVIFGGGSNGNGGSNSSMFSDMMKMLGGPGTGSDEGQRRRNPRSKRGTRRFINDDPGNMMDILLDQGVMPEVPEPDFD